LLLIECNEEGKRKLVQKKASQWIHTMELQRLSFTAFSRQTGKGNRTLGHFAAVGWTMIVLFFSLPYLCAQMIMHHDHLP